MLNLHSLTILVSDQTANKPKRRSKTDTSPLDMKLYPLPILN